MLARWFLPVTPGTPAALLLYRHRFIVSARMRGRGPRLAIVLVGTLWLVVAFIGTMSVPFLGLPGFLILAAAIGGASYAVDRRLHVQLVTHRDIDALRNRGELMALSRAYGLLPTGDLETLQARLHDFVDWKGTAGERGSLSPR